MTVQYETRHQTKNQRPPNAAHRLEYILALSKPRFSEPYLRTEGQLIQQLARFLKRSSQPRLNAVRQEKRVLSHPGESS